MILFKDYGLRVCKTTLHSGKNGKMTYAARRHLLQFAQSGRAKSFNLQSSGQMVACAKNAMPVGMKAIFSTNFLQLI